MVNISYIIKKNRLRKELTQQQLADILNVSRSTVSSWELGRNVPDLDTIIALSDLFELSLDKLLREDRTMTKVISNDSKKKTIYKLLLILLIPLLIICIIYGALFVKANHDIREYSDTLINNNWQYDSTFPQSKSALVSNRGYLKYSIFLMSDLVVPKANYNLYVRDTDNNIMMEINNKQHAKIIINDSIDPYAKIKGEVELTKSGNIENISYYKPNANYKKIKQYFLKHKRDYLKLLGQARSMQRLINKRHS